MNQNSYRCWAEVDLDALRENLAWLRHRVGDNVKIMTVVKADAYGHGLKQIAALLMQSGTDVFGVANLAEARSIRSVGKGWPILMLGACLPEEIEPAVKDGIMPSLSTLAEAELFSAAAVRLKKTVEAHIKIDTGMGRLGVTPEEAFPLIQKINTLPGLKIQGIYTHFANVEDDAAFSARQAKCFRQLVEEVRDYGIPVPMVHINNSGGLLHEPDSLYTLARPGLIVYGIIPPGKRRSQSTLQSHLRPSLSLKSRVSLVKTVPKGTSISYGRTFTTPRAMRIATVTAGYGDGYLRAGSGKSQVLIGGKRCRILGRITMDQMMADVSRIKDVKAGDEVVLIGKQGKEQITATALAEWCNTIPWEVFTSITYRVPRLYKGGQAS